MRKAYMIPLAFVVLSLGLAIYAGFGFPFVPMEAATKTLDVGTELTLENLELSAEKLYRLEVGSSVPDGELAVVGAALLDEEGAPVFELEDAYWSESGTWHEDGESGTWHEANLQTSFDFAVPETGSYEISMSLDESTTAQADGGLSSTGAVVGIAAKRTVQARLLSADPAPLGWVYMLVAAIVFGVAAVLLYFKGAAAQGLMLRRMLGKLTVGSEVEVEGTRYTIEQVRRHIDREGPNTSEWRLRGEAGVRWMAEDNLYWEVPDGEGDTDDREQYVAVLEEDLTDEQEERLERHSKSSEVSLGSLTFRYDSENSGPMELRADGERQKYESRVYIANRLPLEPDALILEHIAYDDGRESWSKLRVLSPSQLRIVKIAKS